MVKTLVTFYSRTGKTKKIGREIAKNLNADIDYIKDLKPRMGSVNFIIAGKDAITNQLTKIKYKKDPSKYDLVIIGTPVWSFTMSPAIRTYLKENKGKFKKIALFCTQGSNSAARTLKKMAELSKKPLATFNINTYYKDIKKSKYEKPVKEFCDKLKKKLSSKPL
jgi:flavodoxin